ncbi:S-adenosyl-L-methionine-dependent methyltransferase [Diaporthe sp. PMI_573]|nr:S-adenosyl-L-methionine-dependent methyltransferase [Diaporthaceae sp. PMI_573]
MEDTVDFSIAVRPNDIDAVPGIVKGVVEKAAALSPGDETARHALLIQARSLVQALETPRETMTKHTWAQLGVDTGLVTGVDAGLWILMAKNGDGPQKVTDLADTLGFDPVLLGRLMRHLAAMGYLIETGVDEYKLTNFTRSMALPQISGGYTTLLGEIGASGLEFHKWARKNNWRNPTDPKNGALKEAYGTDLDVFQYLHFVGCLQQVNNHMRGYRQGRTPWMDPSIYPVQENLIHGAEAGPDAPFLVDIAGGLGHDLTEFKNRFPNHPGKIYLEDLPAVIADIQDLDPTIERLSYDFHTEQPIKGARAYFMHSIMHDWPDHVCKSILTRVVEAMRPGYSKLLINDVVIPSRGAHWENTAGDMLMMTQLSALERTEAQWYQLIEGSGLGLKIVKIWLCGLPGVEGLIECERV